MKNTQKSQVVKFLTDSELQDLKNLLRGKGNLRMNAGKADINERTLERIALAGKGLGENVDKIRKKLLGQKKTTAAA